MLPVLMPTFIGSSLSPTLPPATYSSLLSSSLASIILSASIAGNLIMTMSRAKAAAAASAVAAVCGTIAFLGGIPSSAMSVVDEPSVSSLPMSASPLEFSSIPHTHPDLSHRRLSNALPDGGCELTQPVKPAPNTPLTYAASYPGCGARMSWNLVEALTGLETGDDWNNNGRGEEVVTVKTHYPQSNGILPEFDEKIGRVFIIIRNPMKSIPSFFNHCYEIENHLVVHTQRAPVEAWIKWRDAYVETEIKEYKKFIMYWMDRYPAKDRLLISYEGLTDDFIGPEVAKGLNDFLGQVDGVDPIESDSVPCVWRAVVKNILPPQQAERIKKLQELAEKIELDKIAAETGGQAAAPTQQEGQAAAGGDDAQAQRDAYLAKTAFDLGGGRRALSTAGGGTPGLRRRLDLGHGNSQRKGPDEPRPYTVQQLDMMMSMLMEVAERYKNEDIRLYHVMMGYYEKIRVERIKLDPNGVETPPGGVY